MSVNSITLSRQYQFLPNDNIRVRRQIGNEQVDLIKLRQYNEIKPQKNIFDTFRGAAYTNDVGEGCKPILGEALAKRMWYPSLIYVLGSTVHKTLYDKENNSSFNIGRGAKELAFQTMASLCGPILLVSLGKNTLGKLLSYFGNSVAIYRNGGNPFKELKNQDFSKLIANTSREVCGGIKDSAKELPHDIMSTIKMGVHDILHPKESYNNTLKYLSTTKDKTISSYKIFKRFLPKFNANKKEYLFGKNGLLFGSKGLFGESGLLFGNKSSKVIGGLLGILLLYKTVDNVSEKIVEAPEKIISKRFTL